MSATPDLSTFDGLLQAARRQPDPQRLLLVFAGASLPADATPAQRAEFEAGEGGELAPLMCVDKDPQALHGFAALADEAQAMPLAATGAAPWALVFAAALPGRGGQAPSDEQVDAALQAMVEAVRRGEVGRYLAFDRRGQAVQLG